MDKDQLLYELQSNTFVRLKPSPLHGIGVFAIRNIPKGCKDMFTHEQGEWHKLRMEELENLPESSRQLIETYCLFDEEFYYVPAQGFKSMDLSLFLNHSEDANVRSLDGGAYFEALRDIQEGEELLIDYGEIVDSDE